MDDHAATASAQSTPHAPGAAEAVAHGCRCSVLANAAFRAGVTGATPLIDPTCPRHVAYPERPRSTDIVAARSAAEPTPPASASTALEPNGLLGAA